MFKAAVVFGAAVAVTFGAVAEDLVDPIGLRTYEVSSWVTWDNLTNSEHYVYDPASIEDECAHAYLPPSMTGLHVSNYCAAVGSDTDVITFDWKNHSGRDILSSASGTASSRFSTTSDGEISLASIDNGSYLSAYSSWSISLFDENSNHLGDLNQISTTISILGNTQYNLVFNMGGWNTVTLYASMVSWNVQIAYMNEDTSGSIDAVPGFGGLALLGGLTTLRRRRRR